MSAIARNRTRNWEVIADNLSKAGWSYGSVSAIDFQWANNLDCRRTPRQRRKRFVVRADEKLTAFL